MAFDGVKKYATHAFQSLQSIFAFVLLGDVTASESADLFESRVGSDCPTAVPKCADSLLHASQPATAVFANSICSKIDDFAVSAIALPQFQESLERIEVSISKYDKTKRFTLGFFSDGFG